MTIINPDVFRRSGLGRILAGLALIFLLTGANNVAAQTIAFKQAVAAAASGDRDIAAFYKARDYRPIWTGAGDIARRRAFVGAALSAGNHGLPTGRYDGRQMKRDFAAIRSERARGGLEVTLTRAFLQYARDLQSGVLEPRKLGAEFYVKPPRRDRLATLNAFVKSSPQLFIRALAPQSPAYQRLLKEKVSLEKRIARGGWGPKVKAKKLRPGQSGKLVVALRKRLGAMGYRNLGISPKFDAGLQRAVQVFQTDHGLNADGVAGRGTIAALNVSALTRLQQVIVALERQRWLNKPLGKRYILVNQADFRAFVMDDGRPTLTTRVVVGRPGKKYRTPEFEDLMTHMVINPTWNVPQSIATAEYLPMLKKDPLALVQRGLTMTDVSGQDVDPGSMDYSQYDDKNFPFAIKQPPSAGNALGRVKFMFPNRFNIYLHDTPSKSLFARDRRTFSHGCVRVQKPFQLAYTLLAKQTSDPKGLFQQYLNSGVETEVNLKTPVPVYLTYWTAWITPEGRANFRRDAYGRDKKVFRALEKAGVSLQTVRG